MKFLEQIPETFGTIVDGKLVPDPSFVMEAENARQEAQIVRDTTIPVNEEETTPEGTQKPVDVEKIISERIEEATNAIREEMDGMMKGVMKDQEKEKAESDKGRMKMEKELAKKDKLIASLEKKLGKKDEETKGLLQRIKEALGG